MLRGLNDDISVTRRIETRNSAGGAEISEASRYWTVRCRIDNPGQGDLNRIQGVDGVTSERKIKILVWPATYVFEVGDVVTPSTGRFAGERFIVLDVRYDSLPTNHPRAHIELVAQHYVPTRGIP